MTKFYILTVLALITHFSYSQQSVKFDSYGIEDGLSQSHVTAILEDNFGYIWMATQDGLNRFNGYEFEVYKNQINDSSSIPNNYVHSLVKDSKGMLWFGTNRGIGSIDPLSGEINKINKQTYPDLKGYIFTSLVIDKRDIIWALSEKNGINVINTKTKSVKNIRSIQRAKDFTTIYIDPRNKLWIGNNK